MIMDFKDKMKTDKNKSFLESLKHALNGIQTVFKEERNMTYHVSFSLLTLLAAWFFKINQTEWLFVLTAIFLVFITEVINTCFENLVDLVTNHTYHEIAKKVKDMAAGAVLLAACFAVIVGLIIFLPKLWHLIA